MIIDRVEYIKQLEDEVRKANSIIELKRIENARLKKLVAELESKEAATVKRFYKEGIKDFAAKLKQFYTDNRTYHRPGAHTLIEVLFAKMDEIAKELTGEAK